MNRFNRHYFLTILVIASLIAIYNCKGNKSGDSEGEFYNTNKSKLGIQIVDKNLGIQFYPPKNWVLMPSSLSKKIETRKGIANASDSFIYQPTYVFYNDSTRGILSIGKVSTDDTTLSSNAKMNYYKSLLSNKYKNNDLSLASFSNANITFTQFKFTTENLVSFRLIFENSKKEIVQMDFTVSIDYQNSTSDAIKSSIGSIKLF